MRAGIETPGTVAGATSICQAPYAHMGRPGHTECDTAERWWLSACTAAPMHGGDL